MNEHTSVDHPVLKIFSAWLLALGLKSWSDVAAALAAFYSLLLITEWFWRKFWRPMLEARGIIQPRPNRRKSDRS